MKFTHLEYLLPLSVVFIIISVLIIKNNNIFYKWIEDHWFFKPSKSSRLSSFLFLLGLFILSLAVLDLRGPEKNISVKASETKTVILIDSSASMLTEDVRPNRFEKALFLAKHYVKRAIGQKISIIVFSDSSIKLVPFTEDKNLIDARLDTLKNIELKRGGTGLSLALNEAIQYLRNDETEYDGNILLFTDAEEHEANMELQIPDSITVGVVGVGTAKGGPIPIRDKGGVFRGNKKYKGEVVISKLDEEVLKQLATKIKNYQYWVASSYSLPTEKILAFFNRIKINSERENDFKVRPVYYEYLMIPGVILLILSFLFGQRKAFVLMVSIFFLNTNNDLMAQSINQIPEELKNQIKQKKEEPVKSETTLNLEKELAKGTLSRDGKLALANHLAKDGFPQDAAALFDEVLSDKVTKDNVLDKFNQAAAELQTNKKVDAINKYKEIIDKIENGELSSKDVPKEVLDDVEKKSKLNLLKALQSMGGASGKGEKSEDNEENSDKKNKGDQGEGKDKNQKNKDKSDSSENKNENKGKDKDSDGDKDNKKDQKGDQEKNSQGDKDKKDEKKSETGEEMKKRKSELPQILKQLISDDNKLQKKYIDANTTERKSREVKDW